MSLNKILGMNKKEEDKWRFDEKSIFSIAFNEEETLNFNRLLNVIKNYIDQTQFYLKKEKMIFNVLNGDHTIIINIEKDINYKGKNVKIGFDVEDLYKITIPRKKEMKLSLLNEKIVVEKLKNNGYYTHKEIKTLDNKLFDDLDNDIKNLFKLEYENKFSLTKENLYDLISELGDYSEVLKILVNDDGIKFMEENNYQGMFEYPILKDDLYDFNRKNSKEEFVSVTSYLLKKIKPVFDLLDNDDIITFHVKTQYPIRIDIKINTINADMTCFLAIRVKEDEIEEYDEELDL